MKKKMHEFRDPIHVFIKVTSEERNIIDSRPFQRLRNISQLALTYLIYPGATHKRFEHSLGVMELSTRIFDTIFFQENIIGHLPPWPKDKDKAYWRQALRIAALCHDIGHLPFSHAAESELFPEGYDHERMTIDIIKSHEMQDLFQRIEPRIEIEDIIKLALGPKSLSKFDVTYRFGWIEAILAQIIVSDTFGADRMDYLLRDSYYAGVAYGKFDHYRLIDTLRILTPNGQEEPSLGVEEGGLHSAEALLLARYFMFTQLYLHPIRRIYDIFLKDFLKMYIKKFPIKLEDFYNLTDNEILAAIRKASLRKSCRMHRIAKMIQERKHFGVLYRQMPEDREYYNPGETIFKAACKKFGKENVRHDYVTKSGKTDPFPVYDINSDTSRSSREVSDVINNIPDIKIDVVYISKDYYNKADKWLKDNKDSILKNGGMNEQP